jgi:hypothetical protein
VIALERGKPYPLEISKQDGAEACFLMRGGSFLKIRVNDMSRDEEKALRYGTVKAGLLIDGAALLWLFEFSDDQGPVFTFDAPFDVRAIPTNHRDLPNTENPTESRLLIQVHAVDECGILRGIRGVTLPPELTRKFLGTVMDQLTAVDSGQAAHERWRRLEPVALASMTTMMVCGR